MSRLAPAPAGQPTQGIGTVPVTRVVPRQHASPLEAQRAEAEASGFPGCGRSRCPGACCRARLDQSPRSAHSASLLPLYRRLALA